MKKSFKELNEMERNLMIAGLTSHIILKKGVRIGRNNAIKILNLPTKKRQIQFINKIKRNK